MAAVLDLEKGGISQGKIAGLERTLFYVPGPCFNDRVSLFQTEPFIKISRIIFIHSMEAGASQKFKVPKLNLRNPRAVWTQIIVLVRFISSVTELYLFPVPSVQKLEWAASIYSTFEPIGCVFWPGWGNQRDRLVVWFEIECCGPSGTVCFQICFLQLHLPPSSLVNKIRALGLIIFESLWVLCGIGKYIVSLYTRWHPVIPTRAERSRAAERLSHGQFLFSIWFSHCCRYKGGSSFRHATFEGGLRP